jgi:hypothetical protein
MPSTQCGGARSSRERITPPVSKGTPNLASRAVDDHGEHSEARRNEVLGGRAFPAWCRASALAPSARTERGQSVGKRS